MGLRFVAGKIIVVGFVLNTKVRRVGDEECEEKRSFGEWEKGWTVSVEVEEGEEGLRKGSVTVEEEEGDEEEEDVRDCGTSP